MRVHTGSETRASAIEPQCQCSCKGDQTAPGQGGSPEGDPPPKTTAPTTIRRIANAMPRMKPVVGLSLLRRRSCSWSRPFLRRAFFDDIPRSLGGSGELGASDRGDRGRRGSFVSLVANQVAIDPEKEHTLPIQSVGAFNSAPAHEEESASWPSAEPGS